MRYDIEPSDNCRVTTLYLSILLSTVTQLCTLQSISTTMSGAMWRWKMRGKWRCVLLTRQNVMKNNIPKLKYHQTQTSMKRGNRRYVFLTNKNGMEILSRSQCFIKHKSNVENTPWNWFTWPHSIKDNTNVVVSRNVVSGYSFNCRRRPSHLKKYISYQFDFTIHQNRVQVYW